MSTPRSTDTIHADVQAQYGAIARRHAQAPSSTTDGPKSCCGPSCCGGGTEDAISRDLYSADDTRDVPEEAVKASLGCGNPTALLDLQPGQVVLDLGSGGGIDVLISARRVGPSGWVYGLDMTEDMLALARANQSRAGATNVEFLRGQLEAIPLPDASVDVIISNCVINLSPDKPAALREAFRVLKPGGRFAVSDVVVQGDLPAEVRRSMELWVGCVAGALADADYVAMLQAAGFEGVAVEPWRTYRPEEMAGLLAEAGLGGSRAADAADGRIVSAFIRARKPAA